MKNIIYGANTSLEFPKCVLHSCQLYNFGHLKCVNFAFLVKFDPLKNNPILQIQSPSCVIYKPGQLKFKLNNFNEGGI